MSTSQTQSVMEEAVFTVVLLLACVVFLFAAITVEIHEEIGITSRSLPITITLMILAYSVVKAVFLFKSARRHQFNLLRTDGIVVKVILPLSAAMVLYVPLVMAFGYVLATVMVLVFVLRVFDVRDLGFSFAISVVVGIVANHIFVEMLGMFMPSGWLMETVQGLL